MLYQKLFFFLNCCQFIVSISQEIELKDMLKENSNSYDESDLYKELMKNTNKTTIEEIFKITPLRPHQDPKSIA